jgi:hypothetical protein
MDRTAGEQFVQRWYQSEKRARRMQREFEQPGAPTPWTGSPQDYEDLVGPERSGGLDTIVAKRPTPVPWRDHDGQAPIGAMPRPAPGGLSGGEAKVPAYAGT